jgi:hypothetical protein
LNFLLKDLERLCCLKVGGDVDTKSPMGLVWRVVFDLLLGLGLAGRQLDVIVGSLHTVAVE